MSRLSPKLYMLSCVLNYQFGRTIPPDFVIQHGSPDRYEAEMPGEVLAAREQFPAIDTRPTARYGAIFPSGEVIAMRGSTLLVFYTAMQRLNYDFILHKSWHLQRDALCPADESRAEFEIKVQTMMEHLLAHYDITPIDRHDRALRS